MPQCTASPLSAGAGAGGGEEPSSPRRPAGGANAHHAAHLHQAFPPFLRTCSSFPPVLDKVSWPCEEERACRRTERLTQPAQGKELQLRWPTVPHSEEATATLDAPSADSLQESV